jgi:hypothetical protein
MASVELLGELMGFSFAGLDYHYVPRPHECRGRHAPWLLPRDKIRFAFVTLSIVRPATSARAFSMT